MFPPRILRILGFTTGINKYLNKSFLCPLGASSIDDCSPCPGGFYCEDPGQIDPTGPCSAGFYCPANESITNPAPIGLECPIGHYCTNQTTTPTPCSVGTYQPNIGRDSCIDCQAGFYCESALFPDPKPCPAYHYCPAGNS